MNSGKKENVIETWTIMVAEERLNVKITDVLLNEFEERSLEDQLQSMLTDGCRDEIQEENGGERSKRYGRAHYRTRTGLFYENL